MNVFVYCADIYCEECGKHFRDDIKASGLAPNDPDDESSYDSAQFPKGPYPDGGGEADSPQHCGACGVFLDNPLTGDGEDYVLDAWREYVECGKGRLDVLQEWRDSYEWVWDHFESISFPMMEENGVNKHERKRFEELDGNN